MPGACREEGCRSMQAMWHPKSRSRCDACTEMPMDSWCCASCCCNHPAAQRGMPCNGMAVTHRPTGLLGMYQQLPNAVFQAIRNGQAKTDSAGWNQNGSQFITDQYPDSTFSHTAMTLAAETFTCDSLAAVDHTCPLPPSTLSGQGQGWRGCQDGPHGA